MLQQIAFVFVLVKSCELPKYISSKSSDARFFALCTRALPFQNGNTSIIHAIASAVQQGDYFDAASPLWHTVAVLLEAGANPDAKNKVNAVPR